jgi:hypothetical protein
VLTLQMPHIPFAYEDDLCAILAEHLDRVLHPDSDPRQARTFAQRPVGTVIPDLIYIRSDRLGSGQAERPLGGVTALEASIIVALLSGRPLRDDTIARRLYSRVERIVPRLRELERLGIVEELAEGVFALSSGVQPEATQVVAVEAKLRRWREAVQQAASYLGFANQAFVALPREVIERNEAIRTAAVSARVGLLAVGQDSVQIARVAPQHRVLTADRIWLLSRTVPMTNCSDAIKACSSRNSRTLSATHSGG